MIETVCPLCGLPRPRDAKQCVCNYTFEYGKLPATARQRGTIRLNPIAVNDFAGANSGPD